MENSQSYQVRLVTANGSNFVGIYPQGPPEQRMMLNAYTQTTEDDFSVLHHINPPPIHLEIENKVLREKVLQLETKLAEHSELLSQIHATSARVQQQQMEQQRQQQTSNSFPSPTPAESYPQMLTPPNSVICPAATTTNNTIEAPVIPAKAPEVIDYKIITPHDMDMDDAEAIEIRLAAESLNSLSCSGDSDRLEICMTAAEHTRRTEQFIKREYADITPTPTSSGHVLKRRKLAGAVQECSVPITPFIAPPPAQQSVQETPSNVNAFGQTVLNASNSSNSRRNSLKPKQKIEILEQASESENEENTLDSNETMVCIGPNETLVREKDLTDIKWTSGSLATRKLMVAVFGRDTLATHSMTGRPSPAFKNQPKSPKKQLDPLKVADIVHFVKEKTNASAKEVKTAITTKCADETKMMKLNKAKGIRRDKENQKEID